MHEMRQFTRLGDNLLTSRDGRHVLRYDDSGTATLTDTASGEPRWRAGVSGTLLLGHDGALQVEDEANQPLWASDVRHSDALTAVISDDGDLELLSGAGVRLVNSRTGAVEVKALLGSAPAAAITDIAHLVRQGRHKRTVTRNRDGSLQVTEEMSGGSSSHTLSVWLARWFEQDGAELTWRKVPEARGASWRLVLADAAGALLWRDIGKGAPADVPPSAVYAYGGPELPAGCRLRNQSLTSPNGSHTLVHQEDGNLVLYCNFEQRAVWATDTWWAGNGWADLTDGDLTVRTMYGAPLWRAGTTGATRLVVHDDGTMVLDGTSWVVDRHAGCTRPGMNTARGDTLLRGQVLQRQSLTAPDGVTVFAHRDDRRLVQFAADGTWLWDEYIGGDERGYLALDDDGMLRVRTGDGLVAKEIAGPADALVVTSEGVELRRDGTPFWRNGKRVNRSPGTTGRRR
ncbi:MULTISPECIES: Curculin domain-containing protein (mannose-binding) lectin [unclassified Streptomyces]|uniref:Curculin domain-containing protein (mannose-binding) lectin n=1 Tax=unclassified Streptomyces TaxID=2593676 RepID=UPI0036ECD933